MKAWQSVLLRCSLWFFGIILAMVVMTIVRENVNPILGGVAGLFVIFLCQGVAGWIPTRKEIRERKVVKSTRPETPSPSRPTSLELPPVAPESGSAPACSKNGLLEAYCCWTTQNTTAREIDGHTEITTPWLGKDNGCLKIFAKQEGAQWVITDDGETLRKLRQHKNEVDREKIEKVLARFGVQNNAGTLKIQTSKRDAPAAINNLLQTIMALA